MASTACFFHHHALTPASRSSSSSQRQAANIKPGQLVCRAQKQAIQEDDGTLVSRRLALTVLIGAAAVGSKVSPADAAYGEADKAELKLQQLQREENTEKTKLHCRFRTKHAASPSC